MLGVPHLVLLLFTANTCLPTGIICLTIICIPVILLVTYRVGSTERTGMYRIG
jgi:hypothetical protein